MAAVMVIEGLTIQKVQAVEEAALVPKVVIRQTPLAASVATLIFKAQLSETVLEAVVGQAEATVI
jgi:hypothetical protein